MSTIFQLAESRRIYCIPQRSTQQFKPNFLEIHKAVTSNKINPSCRDSYIY